MIEIPGYRIDRPLKEQGGQASLFLAERLATSERVALKVALVREGGDARRLLAEARALAQIRHPHVVRVIESGEEPEVAWLAMELVRGESLAAAVRARCRGAGGSTDDDTTVELRRAPASPATRDLAGVPEALSDPAWVATVLRLGSEVADGLAALHAQGIVHRDVKPSNVMVVDGRAVLVDLGMAFDSERSALTDTGAVVGTLAYMSPEQARGESRDPRVDVYGLGATLYFALTGEPPFRATSLTRVAQAVDREEPARVEQLNSVVEAAVGRVLRKAMAKEPDARHAQATELRDDLLALLAGERVRTRLHLPELRRRHRRKLRLAGVLTGLLALGGFAFAAFGSGEQLEVRVLRLLSSGGADAVRAVLGGLAEDEKLALRERVERRLVPGDVAAHEQLAEAFDCELFQVRLPEGASAAIAPVRSPHTLDFDRPPLETFRTGPTVAFTTPPRRTAVCVAPPAGAENQWTGGPNAGGDRLVFTFFVDPADTETLDLSAGLPSMISLAGIFGPGDEPFRTVESERRTLLVAEHDLLAVATYVYQQWLTQHPGQADVFRHPDEARVLTEPALPKSHERDLTATLETDFWLAFRLVSFCGCQMMSAEDWKAARAVPGLGLDDGRTRWLVEPAGQGLELALTGPGDSPEIEPGRHMRLRSDACTVRAVRVLWPAR